LREKNIGKYYQMLIFFVSAIPFKYVLAYVKNLGRKGKGNSKFSVQQ
jgi:hypothetical protein